jgi:D-xylose transport system ATP-binding protein
MLAAHHLSKRFGGVTAVDGVSFELAAGEIHALCGENGAGKSTLIKLLSGVHPFGSYGGRIELDARELRLRSVRDAARAGISVICQELALIDELTVAENIFLGDEPTRAGLVYDRRRAEREAAAVIARFGVPIDLRRPVGELGMGEKQLVEIARALARRSRILNLDEPTAALAAHEATALLDILRDLRREGVASIYVSHRLPEVFAVADRITVLRDGSNVTTVARDATTPAEVVRHMVGRELAGLFPRTRVVPGRVVIAARDLAVADGGGRPRLADLSFEVRAGEVLGIGGLMGAGRTELVNHLFGAFGRRTGGTVLFDGVPLREAGPAQRVRAGIALVTEDRRRFGLHLAESVGFNLSLSSLGEVATAGVVRARRERRRNRHWFDQLSVRAAGLDVPVGRLSGGNQQKVVLGRALMSGPKLVLLDEPTRGIDVGARLEIYALVDRLCAEGCAVILVSSELPELIGISDRILMLRDGRSGGCFAASAATPELLLGAAIGGLPAPVA